MNDQPTITPQPEQPDTNLPTQSGTSSAPASTLPAQPVPPSIQNSPKKKRTELLVTIAVVALLVIIGIICYVIFFYISKADYRQAEVQTNAVINAYNKADSASTNYSEVASSALSSDEEIAAEKAKYRAADEAYLSEVKKLSSTRALKNTKVKEAYDAFVAKNKEFVANNNSAEKTIPVVHKIAVNCSQSKIGTMDTDDLSRLVAAYDKAMGPCTAAMKELSNAENADAATVGKKASKFFAEMRTQIVAMQAAYAANDRPEFERNYNTFLNLTTTFNDDTDISKIQKHQDSLSPVTELNRLASVIKPLQ